MCGIVGVVSQGPVNQLIYDALLLLQHRGQDAAGIVTLQGRKVFMHKAKGMVRDVFRTRNMRALPGTAGLGQVRYPTAGNAYSEEEAQPFYVNAPYGIRPLSFGRSADGTVMVASESVTLEGTGHRLERTVAPGEAVFIDLQGKVHARQCAEKPQLSPCIFEFVYLARPDSVMDGISVYQARLNLGETLAKRVISTVPPNEIDVVIPIPESSRPSAMQLAQLLGIPYREGFVKNRYVGRTFIMPGQGVRKKSVRQKLNAIGVEFRGRNVLLVDDSIVRGTTPKEIVQMAREAGARKVYMASAAPPVRFPNVYGIDMPTKEELIAHDRSIAEIREFIGADALIYQDIAAMKRVVSALNPALQGFEASCFDGVYITGDVTAADFDAMAAQRGGQGEEEETDSRSRLALQSASEVS